MATKSYIVLHQGRPVAFVPAIKSPTSLTDSLMVTRLATNIAFIRKWKNIDLTYAESLCVDDRGQLPCLADWLESGT